ncbi:MAG TPA: TOMM precursor leader peptide-binding protein [Nocardioidaceae bacterium]|nr:TOMM precursor leader peptide-binding protein [Nocardioidaceae bacterium]
MRTKTPHAPSQRSRRRVLRPGTHVLRRSADELQVGLDPRRAVVLPDRPEVRVLLDGLRSPASSLAEEEYDGRTLELLDASGLLVDADLLIPLAPAPSLSKGTAPAGASISRADVAALAAHSGDRAVDLLSHRGSARIHVATCGSVEATTVAAGLGELLTRAGTSPTLLEHRQTTSGSAAGPAAGARIGVLVAVGEPDREALDGWIRDGLPHLVLRVTEGAALVGPLVVPGETACLRCIDAHHTDVDPGWPLLVTQQAAAVNRGREDSLPEPVDSLLATLAAAWAAREVVSFVEGRRPATTATTVRLDPHLTALETQTWPRHPACGCAWE